MTDCILAPNAKAAKYRLKKSVGLGRGHSEIKCHTCDNPLCYNPAHVYWGNHSTNAVDKVLRRGGNKLSEGQVVIIRYLRREGYTLKVIGKAFGVTPTMVSRIVRGKSWNHGTS